MRMLIDKLPNRNYFITIFIIVLALFMTFSIVIYKNFREAQNLNAWTIYNYETSRLSRRLLFDLVDMETGVRGYLLSGNRTFLEPYTKSINNVDDQLAYLWEYTKGDPTTRDNLGLWLKDIEKFSQLLDAQIREFSSGKRATNNLVLMNAQRVQMDRLRSSLETYIGQRLEMLQAQQHASEQSHRNFRYVLIIGTLLAVGGTFLAITIILALLGHSRRAEAQSREVEQRFIAIMVGLNDGVFDLNLMDDEVYFSTSFKGMLGYEESEFPNTLDAAWERVHPDDLVQTREVLQDYLQGKTLYYTNVFRMQHKLGGWVWIMSRGVGMRDGDRMVRLIGTHTDLTEQKKREEELEALNAEMEAFTYITSHDLRSPLVNLKGFAKEMEHAVSRIKPILERKEGLFSDDEKQVLHHAIEVDIVESLRFISQSVVKMDTLTTAVLDLSRIGKREYKVESINLNDIVNRCLDSQAYEIAKKNIEIESGDLPNIHSDALALEQVLSNVMDNAIKYLEPARPGKIRIHAKSFGNEIILSIEDNGRGIAAEDKSKVFQIFRRARNSQDVRGMGMGMAYVQATVRKLHGTIWFTSTVGEGTTFLIRLPKQLTLTKGH